MSFTATNQTKDLSRREEHRVAVKTWAVEELHCVGNLIGAATVILKKGVRWSCRLHAELNWDIKKQKTYSTHFGSSDYI